MSGPTQLGGKLHFGRDAQAKVLRAVASVELTKGLVVLLAAFGALSLVHRDAWDVAFSLLHLLHINHQHHYAQVFLELANGVTDRTLLLVAAGAATYSSMRFVEAYGLWRQRAWAEWFAFVSGAIYLPFEVHELYRRPTLIKVVILVVNLAIVLYMLYLRLTDRGQARLNGHSGTS
jgi:uncharacterized membrane protein (DUF2068 family)